MSGTSRRHRLHHRLHRRLRLEGGSSWNPRWVQALGQGLLLGLFLGICAAPASAWPVFDEAESFGSVRLLPDHENPSRFYTLVDRLVLDAADDGSPGLRFDRIRYTGSTLLDDVGELWARGVLTFRVRFEAEPADLARAQRRAQQKALRFGGAARLEPLPPVEVRASVVYVVVDADAGGTLPAATATEGSVWSSRTFALGLEPDTAELLWHAFERDSVALSVSYSVAARGLESRPDAAPIVHSRVDGIGGGGRERLDVAGEDEEPEPVVRSLGGGALPIRLSPSTCPPCFGSIELDAEIPAAFTTVTVFCHDFDLAATPDDLVEIRVEVKANSAVEGQVVRSTRFVATGERRSRVHFPVAVRLDDGFEYRTVEIFGDAHTQATDWRSSTWSRILDVTRRASSQTADSSLDPRQLY